VRLAYLTKAISKRVWKLDGIEDVFEGDDIVQWEGGWTLWVEARRQGGETVECALMVDSHTPRGHPALMYGQCTCLLAKHGGNGSPKRSS